jgi:hypothetical protein
MVMALAFPTIAQIRAEQTDLPISAATRTEVIESILKKLNDSYVFPEVAAQMEKAIRARMQRGEYDRITSSMALAQILTAHLREVSHDLHLGVTYNYEPTPVSTRQGEPTPEQRERMRRFAAPLNFGFERIDRLEGNIGYLRIDGFIPADVSGETAIAAMNFLANTDALIFDLRNNHGGAPSMVTFLSSYLFDSEPIHPYLAWRLWAFKPERKSVAIEKPLSRFLSTR